jgi:hypothetical protein
LVSSIQSPIRPKQEKKKSMWQPNSPTQEQAVPDLEAVARQRSASTKLKNPGRRFASIVKVRPECVEEYKAAHVNVWPEVLKQIKDCGIEECKPSPHLPFTCSRHRTINPSNV